MPLATHSPCSSPPADNASGYKLDGIGLEIRTYENVTVTVSLYSDDSGSPESSIFTFGNPSSGITAGAVNTFTPPDDDVLTHLGAMTPYFIVVSGEPDLNAGSTFDFLLAATNVDAEDTAGKNDWEIADERHSLSGTTWSTDSATLKIRVNGHAATGICGRTPVVQELIIYYLAENEGLVRTCAEVNDADLASLTDMSWAGEGIGPLQSGDFAGLTNVTSLELGRNDFTTLPADLFSDMTALVSINLAAGKLTALPDGVFSGLTALTIILLSGNDLSSLPAGLFSGLMALGNPFSGRERSGSAAGRAVVRPDGAGATPPARQRADRAPRRAALRSDGAGSPDSGRQPQHRRCAAVHGDGGEGGDQPGAGEGAGGGSLRGGLHADRGERRPPDRRDQARRGGGVGGGHRGDRDPRVRDDGGGDGRHRPDHAAIPSPRVTTATPSRGRPRACRRPSCRWAAIRPPCRR